MNSVSVDGTLSSGAVTISSAELVTVGAGSGRGRGVEGTLVHKSVGGTSIKVDGKALSRSTVSHGTSAEFTALLVSESDGTSGTLLELGREVALEWVDLAGVLLKVGEILGVLGAEAVHVSVDLGPVDLVGTGDL